MYLVTTTTNGSDPLQPLLCSLEDPAHATGTKDESRVCTGASQRTSRLHEAFSRVHQVDLTLDICKHRGILIMGLSHTHWFPHSHLLSSSGCLVLHQFSCKIATRTTQLSPNSIVSGLCSVLIPKWEHLGSWGQGSSPRTSESGLGWFSSADGGPYLHDLLVYKKLCHQMTSERTEFRRTFQCHRFCDVDGIWEI